MTYRTDRGQILPKKFTVNVAPSEVMKLIRCQCHALSKRCEGQCSCKEAGLRRTMYEVLHGCNYDDVPGFKTLQMMLMMILKRQSTIVILILMTCDLLKLNFTQ